MTYLGDFAIGSTFDLKFTTVNTSGVPTTLAGTPVVSAYPDNSVTELTAGITLTVDFDARTGLNNVRVVATSGNGYATGVNYQLIITTGTVGGSSVVGYVVGQFSVEARSALRPATSGRTLVVDAAGLADANTVKLGPTGIGTAQTARDLGASVLLSTGTGTGQLDFTSGVVKANLVQILATALTETAGQIAAAFKKFFDKATPTGTINSIPDAVAGAAGGLFIAGSNAATTVNFTGNLSGSVGSVTGAVGSVAAGGIAAASFAAGAIDAAAIAANAIGASELAADAVTEIRSVASGTAASGSTTTMTDAGRTEADTDYWKGQLIVFTSGVISGQARVITAFNPATDTITFAPATTQAVGTQTYEIWPVGDFLRPATSGRTLVVDAAGLADANAVKLGPTGAGTAQTARDIGASVLLSSGTGTGQLDFTSGVAKANLVQILATALTETAGQIAAGFKKLFDVAAPIFTLLSNNQTGDNFARLGAPAGASVSADIASIKTDTGTTIPARLPAALVGGKMDSDATSISGDSVAADNLEKEYDGTGYGHLLQRTTIATLATQVSFTLTAGSANNSAYNGCLLVVENAATPAQKAIGVISAYTGATKTVTLLNDPAIFTMAVGDIVTVIGDRSVKPTADNRTLDVSAGGEAGLDWANVGSPTTTQNLSGTTVKNATDVLADTDDIQTRLPAALVSGRMDSSLGAVAANAITAAGIADGAIDRATLAADTGLQTIRSGTAQAGAAGTITLDASASAIDGFYADTVVLITGATGVGQVRRIRAYVGATKVATVVPNWTTNPDVTSTFAILPLTSVWDETLADHLDSGSTGAALNAVGDPWNTALPGAYGVGTAGKIVGDNVNAKIGDVKTKTDQLTFTIANKVDSSIQAAGDFAQAAADKVWLAVTRTLTAFGFSVTVGTNSDKTGYALSVAGQADVVDKWGGRNIAGGSDGGRTNRDAMRLLRNRRTIVAGTLTAYQEDDATSAWTAVVTTAVGNPVDSIDPA